MTPYSTIRRATVLDKKDLLFIEESCFTYDKITPVQMNYLLTKAKALIVVYTHNNTPVGYAILLTPKHPKPARLYSLAVLLQFQGKQIGSHLLSEIVDHSVNLNYTSLRLEVRASQHDLIKLYKRFGFTPHKLLPNYYEDGEDGLKMIKQFKHN